MEPDLPPRTWQRAKWAWKLFKADMAEDGGDFQEGIQLLDDAAQSKALPAFRQVQRAMLLLKAERLAESQSAFAALRKEFDGATDPDLQYLKRYCTAILGTITGNSGVFPDKTAESIPCKRRLKRRFPV